MHHVGKSLRTYLLCDVCILMPLLSVEMNGLWWRSELDVASRCGGGLDDH